METPEIHVEELKKDPEFLANIQRLEIECKEEESCLLYTSDAADDR